MSESKVIKIGTHDGVFHCDEALAIFLLKLLPKYKDAVIVRSRDLNILETCDIVVDVGGKYDHSICRYDHHMRDFKESLSSIVKEPGCDSEICLSSAGLIYCHYGHEIIKLLAPPGTKDNDIKAIFKNVYYSLIQEIDAIDNGILMCKEEPLYNILTGISSRVSRLNSGSDNKTFDVDKQFQKAIELVGEEFLYAVHHCINEWLPARNIVQKAVENRFKVHTSGEIIILEKCVPWNVHLSQIEKEQNLSPLIKYVIFEDVSKGYRIRAIPVIPGSFLCRIFLPEEWRGLRSKELEMVSGINGTIFVHANGFIGGNETLEGAIQMAVKAINVKEPISDVHIS
ncbi:hypothetical protein M0802_010454 [Mischocyttarus mexicanus]|nr:hypothetical protein M0802_010454 [Mischocyttarus mexicanus]